MHLWPIVFWMCKFILKIVKKQQTKCKQSRNPKTHLGFNIIVLKMHNFRDMAIKNHKLWFRSPYICKMWTHSEKIDEFVCSPDFILNHFWCIKIFKNVILALAICSSLERSNGQCIQVTFTWEVTSRWPLNVFFSFFLQF